MGSQGGAAPLQEANSSNLGLPFTSPYRRAHYSNASIRTLLTIPGRERAACLLFGLTASPSLWLSRLTVLSLIGTCFPSCPPPAPSPRDLLPNVRIQSEPKENPLARWTTPAAAPDEEAMH